ncbi:MAG: D-glycero-beta-D-manno-heptose-7-phosphate kinase [Fusobacteria bacterium]|nr:D-glycero-beta-D-manno-heptose-7-phosphate kinase [Fusobacteriota bacterium]
MELTIKRAKEIMGQFKGKKIAVIGDMMIDEYIVGIVERISPEAPVQVLEVQSQSFVLGGAANVINNLCSLGAKAVAGGVIGEDENGKKLEKEFSKRGVDEAMLIEDHTRPTIVKQRILAQHQQLLRLDWENKKCISEIIEDQIIESFKERLPQIEGVILSDYDKGVLTYRVAQTIIKEAKKQGKMVIIDPKPSNKRNYHHASSMTPNVREAMALASVHYIENEEDFISMGKSIKENLELDNLVITRSEQGMTIFDGNDVFNIPTYAKEVFDVTGAGDTVIATYTLALTCGASYVEAAKLANLAAGIVVARVGTSTATPEEIVDYMKLMGEQDA